MRNVPERLRAAARLFEERNKVYGSNYKTFGQVMAAMYPDGLTVKSAEEWTRIILQVHRITKETRYASNFRRGGHADSMEDLAVYAEMAAETDEAALVQKEQSAASPTAKLNTLKPYTTAMSVDDPPEDSCEWRNNRIR